MGLRREAAASLGRFFAQGLAMALTVPIMVRELGAADYGLWILAWSLFGLAGLFDFGFGTAAVKLVAEDRSPAERNAKLSTVFAILTGLAFLSVPAVAAVARVGVDLSKVDVVRGAEIYLFMVLLGLRLITFGLPLSLYRGVLFGGRQIVALSAIQTAASLVLALSIWMALHQGAGLVTLASLNLGVMLLEHGAMAWWAHHRIPDLELSWRLCRWREAPELFAFASAFFLSGLAGAVLLRTDPIIVQVGTSLAAVAAYGLALKVVEMATGLVKQVTNLLAPRAARLAAADDLAGLLLLSTRLGLAAAGLFAVPLILLAEPLLSLWLGEVPEHTASVLAVLGLALLASGAQLGASGVLAMSGAHHAMGRVALGSAATNLVLSLLWVGPFGVLGVAGATLVATLIFDVAVVPTLAARRTGQSPLRLWHRTLAPLAAPATVWVGGLVTIRVSALPSSPYLPTLAAGVVATATATAITAAWVLTRRTGFAFPWLRTQSQPQGETV